MNFKQAPTRDAVEAYRIVTPTEMTICNSGSQIQFAQYGAQGVKTKVMT